jgi:hypothetical protein
LRVLLDQGARSGLRFLLPEHQVETAFFNGWSKLSNGARLDAAEKAVFEALITGDKGLQYQQNFTGRRISVLVQSTIRWPDVQAGGFRIQMALATVVPGDVVDVNLG